jgi:hypothetical protein
MAARAWLQELYPEEVQRYVVLVTVNAGLILVCTAHPCVW